MSFAFLRKKVRYFIDLKDKKKSFHTLAHKIFAPNVSPSGWRQRRPYEGSLSHIEGLPSVPYRSTQGAPTQPSTVSNPAVTDKASPSPGAYPASASLTPDLSSEASLNAPPVWDPLEESTNASRNTQPAPYVDPPLFLRAGEPDHDDDTVEPGNADGETEELNLSASPYPDFQAGELSRHALTLEHGNQEWETEERGFMPPPPYASAPQGVEASAASTTFPAQPDPRELMLVGWSQYLLLTGQLPSGTYNRFLSDYETGGGQLDEAHYEQYYFPTRLW